MPGTRNPQVPNEYIVSSDNLHAWPELHFDGLGWVRFEPTPSLGTIPEYAACLQFRRIVRTMAFRQAFAYSMGVSAPDRVIPVPAPLPNVPEGYLFTSYIASFETLPG